MGLLSRGSGWALLIDGLDRFSVMGFENYMF